MRDYSMFNKMKIWFSLLITKIENYIYPDMIFTLDQYFVSNETEKNHHLFVDNRYDKLTNDTKKTYIIPISDLPNSEIGQLILDYKEEINWDEIVFVSNKKEDLN